MTWYREPWTRPLTDRCSISASPRRQRTHSTQDLECVPFSEFFIILLYKAAIQSTFECDCLRPCPVFFIYLLLFYYIKLLTQSTFEREAAHTLDPGPDVSVLRMPPATRVQRTRSNKGTHDNKRTHSNKEHILTRELILMGEHTLILRAIPGTRIHAPRRACCC